MKKKLIALSLSVIMTSSFFLTEMINAKETKTISIIDSNSVISDELKDILLKKSRSSGSEKIPVSIEFIDDYDEEEVDEQAYKMVDITESELITLQNDIEKEQDIMLSYGRSKIEVEKINEVRQTVLMERYNKVSEARIDIIETKVRESTRDFLKEADISYEDVDSMCTIIPMISLVWLTPEQIIELENNSSVTHIEYVDVNEKIETYVTNAQTIIGGNVAVNSGYTGSSIKVGVIDASHPKLSKMGTDSANIILTNSGSTGDHSTWVCGIIRKMAPRASIYSSTVSYIYDILPAAEKLVSEYGVHVINLSAGKLSGTGTFNAYSRGVDEFIYRTRCTMCIAAGNPENSSQTISNMYVNQFGLAPNAITVGAVTRTGINPDATGAYRVASYSMYREATNTVNKPDVCAPGNVSIYGDNVQGTSFSTPLVTGTVVQMMARNSGLRDKPEILKAALIASATRDGGTSMSYVKNSIGSDREGAGVIDARFCYYVARNGRRGHFDVTESGTRSINVYCDNTEKTFRVAAAWYVNSSTSNGTTKKTDFDIRIYKNGTFVSSSLAYANSSSNANTNYEVIELSPSVLAKYGAGYYEVRISTSGTFNGPSPNRIGIAWEQVR